MGAYWAIATMPTRALAENCGTRCVGDVMGDLLVPAAIKISVCGILGILLGAMLTRMMPAPGF